jgi:hypothetical protein
MTARRLLVLLRYLPPDGAVAWELSRSEELQREVPATPPPGPRRHATVEELADILELPQRGVTSAGSG